VTDVRVTPWTLINSGVQKGAAVSVALATRARTRDWVYIMPCRDFTGPEHEA